MGTISPPRVMLNAIHAVEIAELNARENDSPDMMALSHALSVLKSYNRSRVPPAGATVLQGAAGETVEVFVRRLVETAKRNKKVVWGFFNDERFVAWPSSTPEEVIHEYHIVKSWS